MDRSATKQSVASEARGGVTKLSLRATASYSKASAAGLSESFQDSARHRHRHGISASCFAEDVSCLSPSELKLQEATAALQRKREEREDRERWEEAVARAKLRETVSKLQIPKAKSEKERLLDLMREKGSGSITVAWRRYCDMDGDFTLSFPEFCRALVGLGMTRIDTLRLWQDLGHGPRTSCLQLKDLDPHGASILDFFGRWCRGKVGGPTKLFDHMDKDQSEGVTMDEFLLGLEELGFFKRGDLPAVISTRRLVEQNLFPLLDVGGQGSINVESLAFLETGMARAMSRRRASFQAEQEALEIRGPREAEFVLKEAATRLQELWDDNTLVPAHEVDALAVARGIWRPDSAKALSTKPFWLKPFWLQRAGPD